MKEVIRNRGNFWGAIAFLVVLTLVYAWLHPRIPSELYQFLGLIAMVFMGMSMQTCTYQVSEEFFSAELSMLFSKSTAPMVFIHTWEIRDIRPYRPGCLPSPARAMVVRAFLRARLRKKYVLILSPQDGRERYIVISPSAPFLEQLARYFPEQRTA